MATPRPAGPRGAPIVGHALAFVRDPLGFLTEAARYPGEVVHFRQGTRDVYLLKHPDLIKEVLVTHQHDFAKGRGLEWAKHFLGEGLLTSEGDFHTRQRRLAQPAFHRQRIGAYGRVMTEHARSASERWRDGERLELDHEMMRLTLGVAARTLFDTDLEGEAARIRQDLATILEVFPRFALPFREILRVLPLPSNLRFARAVRHLDAIVYRIIAERRASGEDRGDLLSMLVLARDTDGSNMSDGQLRDEVMTLLLAGHETTANALTWTFYLLAQNPDAEERLHEELDRVLAGREPGVDDLPALAYAERVLAESMRLYPPAWGLGRRALRDLVIGGFELRAGSIAAMSPYVIHRDARWWPDPQRFEPERFTAEAKAARPRFAYFPFGAGARSCIGEPFAWMEGVLVLAALAQRWRLSVAPGHRVAPQALITLRPRHGMKMVAHARRRA